MEGAAFDKSGAPIALMAMASAQRSSGARAPLPLLAGFALFVAGLVYLVVMSLTRRDAPVFAPSPAARTRAANWERVGDTLTLDATDTERWRFVSLSSGRPLAGSDTAAWELAARRFHIIAAGALADLGPVPFADARLSSASSFVPSGKRDLANDAIGHWYRYSLVTHLLMPGDHVYALRTADGRLWKLQLLGYYCPGLVAGCVTLRYAPLTGEPRQGAATLSSKRTVPL
jgi:hypothetical protein